MDSNPKRYCTVPDIGIGKYNFRKWFERNYGDACELHDEGYMLRNKTRLEIDRKFRDDMIKSDKDKSFLFRVIRRIFTYVTYYVIRIVGKFYW